MTLINRANVLLCKTVEPESQAWISDPDTLQLVLGHLEHEKGTLLRMGQRNFLEKTSLVASEIGSKRLPRSKGRYRRGSVTEFVHPGCMLTWAASGIHVAWVVSSLGSTRAASTLEILTLIPTSMNNEYWMPPEGRYSGPLTPPDLFNRFGALRRLVIDKPILGPEDDVFSEQLGDFAPPVEPKYDSIWSHEEAKKLWGKVAQGSPKSGFLERDSI
ncbi:hypothetical protein B0J17DRAFT_628604 [Rhizoctonia solani]|nr:hypothetical protein B0J17DRAFT_628604 [Rhizoctonia solani]